jgi:hypothetical protein
MVRPTMGRHRIKQRLKRNKARVTEEDEMEAELREQLRQSQEPEL